MQKFIDQLLDDIYTTRGDYGSLSSEEKREVILDVLVHKLDQVDEIRQKASHNTSYVSYIRALENSGFQRFFQGYEKQGYQTLLVEPNSKAICSVEIVPDTDKAIIRTKASNNYSSDTKQVIELIAQENPNFSSLIPSRVQDLPLISLAEEQALPYCAPLYDRIDKLTGSLEATADTYFATGVIPGYSREFVRDLEREYILDDCRAQIARENVIKQKLEYFPEDIAEFYRSGLQDKKTDSIRQFAKKDTI